LGSRFHFNHSIFTSHNGGCRKSPPMQWDLRSIPHMPMGESPLQPVCLRLELITSCP
jgi:hypothetical protein